MLIARTAGSDVATGALSIRITPSPKKFTEIASWTLATLSSASWYARNTPMMASVPAWT